MSANILQRGRRNSAKSLVVLDTCFAMQDEFYSFILLEGFFRLGERLIVPYKVKSELHGLTHSTNNEVREKAERALHEIEQIAIRPNVSIWHAPHRNRRKNADGEISAFVQQHIERFDLAILTHDYALMHELRLHSRNSNTGNKFEIYRFFQGKIARHYLRQNDFREFLGHSSKRVDNVLKEGKKEELTTYITPESEDKETALPEVTVEQQSTALPNPIAASASAWFSSASTLEKAMVVLIVAIVVAMPLQLGKAWFDHQPATVAALESPSAVPFGVTPSTIEQRESTSRALVDSGNKIPFVVRLVEQDAYRVPLGVTPCEPRSKRSLDDESASNRSWVPLGITPTPVNSTRVPFGVTPRMSETSEPRIPFQISPARDDG